MRGITPILAEIADKVPSLTDIWQLATFCSVVCSVLSLWRPRGLLLALLTAAVSVIFALNWLLDPIAGPAIFKELGQDYMTQAYIAGFLPVVALGVGFLLGLFLRRRCNSKLLTFASPAK